MDRTKSGARVQWPLRPAKVRQRERRNSFAIHAYTGSNGGGKTLAAVYDSLPALAAGRPIVSTCRILDPRTGEPHPLWVPLDDYRVLLDLSYCDVILDEVTGVASARDSAGMPSAVLNRLMQLRKGDVTIRWTTPNWKRADVGIREVTQGLTTCVGVMPREVATTSEDGLKRKWKQRRLFVWRTYDAKNFDEWSTAKERSPSKQHRIRPITRQVVWGPGSITQDCYDTYEVALTLGVVSDAGLCMDCGGKRRPKACACKDGSPHKDPSRGMRLWKEVDAARRRPFDNPFDVADDRDELERVAAGKRLAVKVQTEIAETDDTPAVVVETAPAL